MPRAARRPASTAPRARRVLAYVRVSTEMQADGGHSLEAQRSKVAAWCALHDAELVAVFEDAGLSAATLDRPALAAALAELEADPGDRLLSILARTRAALATLPDPEDEDPEDRARS